MQRKLISQVSLVAVPAALVCGLFFAVPSQPVAASSPHIASSAPADDDDDNRPCSNRTIRGDYGSAVEGVVLPAPGVSLPLRGVVMTHNDGQGNFTQVDHIIVNGEAPPLEWTPGSGTYHINPDCTGTAHIVPSAGGFVNLKLVVVRGGKVIHAVVTPPYDGPNRTVTSIATKVD